MTRLAVALFKTFTQGQGVVCVEPDNVLADGKISDSFALLKKDEGYTVAKHESPAACQQLYANEPGDWGNPANRGRVTLSDGSAFYGRRFQAA